MRGAGVALGGGRTAPGEMPDASDGPATLVGGASRGAGVDPFTDGARSAMRYAEEEARRLNHNYIGTEHQLLGLLRQGEGVAATVLVGMGIDLTKAHAAV